MRAAVFREPERPVSVEEVEIAAPRAGEVSLDIVASGICRSDLSVIEGTLKSPLPVVLGHEAAGVVTALGEGVEHLAVGDRVVVALTPSCGDCLFCREGTPNRCLAMVPGMVFSTMGDRTTRLSVGNETIYQLCGVASFAEQAVVDARACLPVGDDIPLERACLLGCGVLTGAGAALNSAEIGPGAHVAVIGCGGVGLAAVQGARIAGAESILAVDIDPAKRELAMELGATDTVDGSRDVQAAVRKQTGLGVHVAIEAIGKAETIETAWEILRPGGTALIIGMPRSGEKIPIRAGGLFLERRLVGSVYGGADPRRDIPLLLDHVRQGTLRLDPLVTAEWPLQDVALALDALREGRGARHVIVHNR